MNMSPVVNVSFPYRFPIEANKYTNNFITKLSKDNIKDNILINNNMKLEYDPYNLPQYTANNLMFRIKLQNYDGSNYIDKFKDVPTFSKVMLIATKDVI